MARSAILRAKLSPVGSPVPGSVQKGVSGFQERSRVNVAWGRYSGVYQRRDPARYVRRGHFLYHRFDRGRGGVPLPSQRRLIPCVTKLPARSTAIKRSHE